MAASKVGASGVTPTMWKSATAPEAGGGGAHGFELIFGRLDLQAIDHRDAILGDLAEQMAEDGIEAVVLLHGQRQIDQAEEHLAGAVLGQVQAHGRDAAGDRATDVEQVRVAFGAGADHGVGEDDGVGLAPGHLLAKDRFPRRLVGRAGPGRDGAHALVGHHLAMGLCGPVGGDGPFLPVVFVQAADVERGGHGDAGAQAGQALGKFQPGGADIDGAVDVGAGDVEQLGRARDLGHAREDRHRQLAGGAMLASQHSAVVGRKG